MAHSPPVPPDQLSDVVRGEHAPPDRRPEVKDGARADTARNGDARGANIAQNTHHQGHQQDR
jgi:hypothetical protein